MRWSAIVSAIGQFATCTSPKMHLICPPPPTPRPLNFASAAWFSISLGTAVIPKRNGKQRLCNFFFFFFWGGGVNKVHYEWCAGGANSSRSNDATATTTSPKKLISVLSVFIVMILTYLDKCTRILLNLNSKGPYSSSESEIKFRRCLFTSYLCKNGKEVYEKAWCTCKVVVLLMKPVVFFNTFSLPSRCWILKSLIFFPLFH